MTSSRTSRYFNEMKFTLDARTGINLIRGYSPREITAGSHTLNAPCIISADRIVSPWGPATLSALTVEDLGALFALQPDIVLIGTPGERVLKDDVRAAFAARRLAPEVMDLGAACRTFNILVQEERQVAAALFLERGAA
jgi:uncharacterized protein